jgi:hypothetical protein
MSLFARDFLSLRQIDFLPFANAYLIPELTMASGMNLRMAGLTIDPDVKAFISAFWDEGRRQTSRPCSQISANSQRRRN